MRTIHDILEAKARPGVVSVTVEATVIVAVRRMDEANTGSVVVLDDGSLAGIFTERDLMRRVVLGGKDIEQTRVSEVMTRDLLYAAPSDTVSQAMARMTQQRCRHLPVVDQGRLAGVVSIGDLMKQSAEEQTVELEFLKGYITSG